MERFTTLSGVAAPLPIINLDTDKIFPAVYLKTIKRTGLSQWLFQEIRFRPDGSENPDFVLNQAPYRDSAINLAKFSGEGPWERHPNGDEIVQVVDGATTFHIMAEDGPQSFVLKAGMVVIVPQGKWHRFEAPDGVTLMTTTPQPTQHLTFAIDDPRTLDKA